MRNRRKLPDVKGTNTVRTPELAPIIDALNNPFFELCEDECAIVLRSIADAHAAGQSLDEACIALCGVLRRQLAGDDADFELCVDHDGLEDVDDDMMSHEETDDDILPPGYVERTIDAPSQERKGGRLTLVYPDGRREAV